jgi:hypothetical protein
MESNPEVLGPFDAHQCSLRGPILECRDESTDEAVKTEVDKLLSRWGRNTLVRRRGGN